MRSIIKTMLHFPRYLFKLNAYLYLLEQLILRRNYHSDKPQIFILGLPRSGTTIVYQYIVHRLEVAYFTNGVGKYPLSPCLATFFQTKRYGKYQSDFKSHYGKVNGPVAPREAGGFWGRFFGIEKYIRFQDVSTKDIHTLQNTIACVQDIFGNKTFVNKNVKHMLRIDALSKIFPNSYFLIVDRNLNDIAISNIRGKYKILKNPKDWWSVKPQNYEELKNLPIVEQVAYQLISLKEQMESDFSRIPKHRIIRVAYDEFCKNPESLIEMLTSLFEKSNFRNSAKMSFDCSQIKPKTSEEENLIRAIAHATAR